MTARFIFTSCCLFTLLLLGCDSASSKTDVGPMYTVPSGTGSQIIGGVTYAYVATSERQQAIVSGYAEGDEPNLASHVVSAYSGVVLICCSPPRIPRSHKAFRCPSDIAPLTSASNSGSR